MPKPNEKIALYGGSFDPIHIGHLILARDALEQLGLDQVVFLPARISPHKLDRPPAPPKTRCQMLEAALSSDPDLVIDDCEIRRTGPSFTVDTIHRYRETHPDAQLFYLIGDDNLAELHTWKDIDQLRQLVQFVVLARRGAPDTEDFPRITRTMEISSTEIRNRIARGLSVEYMVPGPAHELMIRNGLYRND